MHITNYTEQHSLKSLHDLTQLHLCNVTMISKHVRFYVSSFCLQNAKIFYEFRDQRMLISLFQTDEPIMAHPPDVDSDLTFEEWITGIMATPKRGMKLDFKLIDAVPIALEILGSEFDHNLISLHFYYSCVRIAYVFNHVHVSISVVCLCVSVCFRGDGAILRGGAHSRSHSEWVNFIWGGHVELPFRGVSWRSHLQSSFRGIN